MDNQTQLAAAGFELTKAKTLFIIEYMSEVAKEPAWLPPLLVQMRTSILNTSFKSGRKGMQAAWRDMLESTKSLSPAQLRELDKRFAGKFGIGLMDEDRRVLSRVDVVLKRGIRDADEYRLLQGRLDQIASVPARMEEVSAIQRLMRDYELKARRR